MWAIWYFHERVSLTRTLLQRASISLAWRLDRETRRRLILHETAFTCWGFFTSYFIDVDTFYLFLSWFSTRVSDDRKYVCGRRLYACIKKKKFNGLDSREITSLPEIKKVIYMARHFNHRQKYAACHPKSHLNTVKIYNTRPSQFC